MAESGIFERLERFSIIDRQCEILEYKTELFNWKKTISFHNFSKSPQVIDEKKRFKKCYFLNYILQKKCHFNPFVLENEFFQENINFVPKNLDFSSYLRNATISMEFYVE